MDDILGRFSRLLTDVILPNIQSVQASQAEQIAANDRLEHDIEQLRIHLETQFNYLSSQLTACRAELTATQALLKAHEVRSGFSHPDRLTLIH